jgi:hypothetical protein
LTALPLCTSLSKYLFQLLDLLAVTLATNSVPVTELTAYPTDRLTSWNRVSFEKLAVIKLVKKFSSENR